MKNYLAHKSFSRGTSIYGAEASMAFIGNTTHTVPYMLKNSDLFDELPDAYRDPAWLDRVHHYIPGWEVAPIRSEMFSTGYGFVGDCLAEILRAKRSEDFSDKYQDYFTPRHLTLHARPGRHPQNLRRVDEAGTPDR